MVAKIIDGKMTAEEIRRSIASQVETRVKNGRSRPGLATILVGDDPASHVHVKNKHKACQEAGIESFGYELPASVKQGELENLVKKLNDDSLVNGILIQLPLPPGFDEERILNTVRIEKDVDGFHPLNIGRLAQKGREPLFVSCTPAGVMFLLEKTIGKLDGVNAVVLGRSNIVGMPVALLLVRANATVTICHSRTKDLPEVVKGADVLVAAVGKAEMVRGSWIKPGSVVIDVGINRIEDLSRPKGTRLVGDVAFDEAKEIAGWITPVPGGVGPMTIAMLLQNTMTAANLSDK